MKGRRHFHSLRRSLTAFAILFALMKAPSGTGAAPAARATNVVHDAFTTNGLSRGTAPIFRLPTQEDLRRQEQNDMGGGSPGVTRRQQASPALDPVARARMQQQVDDYFAQRERENPPVLRESQVVERGLHHNQWETYRLATNETGRVEVRTNSYVELGMGLNRLEAGVLVPAQAVVELHPQGAVGRLGAHRVLFSPNVNQAKAIEVETSDGKVLKSHVLGLFYFDMATGKSVRLTALKDSQGAVHPPNVVVYADAFADLRADLRYTYKLNGFEQDVILREQPPAPEDVGLNPETSQLVVLTEFVDAPEPRREARGIKKKQVQGQEVDTLTDETLDFGRMMMGVGRAFRLEQQPGDMDLNGMDRVPVGKRWLQQDGRTFLIEAVEYPDIKPHLPGLPRRAQVIKPRPLMGLNEMLASFSSPGGVKPASRGKMQVASLPLSGAGLVVDYDLVYTTNDFTFEGGKTYYVSGAVTLSGTTTIEGGAVVKYAPTVGTNATYLGFSGPVTLKTSDFRPAVFTARDDDTVGETITGSTGTPSGYYANTALSFAVVTSDPLTLENLRISYANYGISAPYRGYVTCRNIQVLNCNVGLFGGSVGMKTLNCLIGNTIYGVIGENSQPVQVENCTFSACSNAFYAWGTSGQVKATNNIFSSVISYGTYTSLSPNYNGVYNSPALTQNNGFTSGSSPFQAVGGANCYLPTNSAWRNVGTTSIDSQTTAAIQRRTTEAPLVVSGWLAGNNTYAKRVARDTNTPDLGYHYAPLDYVFAACALTNGASVKIMPGTCIGVANTYTNGAYYGLFLNPTNGWSTEFQSFGLPTDPNRFVLFNSVQESAYANWNQNVSGLVVASTNSWVTGGCRFTEFIVPGMTSVGTFLASGTIPAGSVSFRHSSFLGGTLGLGALNCEVFNCLLDRAAVSGTTAGTNTFFNNTFLGGSAAFLTPPSAGSITIKDNFFIRTVLSSTNSVTNSYNGFLTGYNRLYPTQATDVVTTGIAFQPGPLGNYYLAQTNAGISVGSRLASTAGLYHFTTSTNQTKETNSTVDLGYHYVAVNGSGLPVDTDGDGLPDYFEDWNGNGTWDAGETSFTNAYSLAANLPDGLVDLDYDGVTAIQEYQAGTDPTDGTKFIFEPKLLGRWRFDTSALTGDQGQVPRYTNNVSLVSSWNTNAVLLSGSNTLIRLLNVDYASGSSAPYKVGLAAYGIATNDYWYSYYYPGSTDVTVTNLLWANQTNLPAGAKLRVQNAPGQWGTYTGDLMYDGYVYDWNGAGISSTYSGLPPGLYDLYLYGHGAAPSQNTIFNVFTSTRNFGSKNTIVSANWASIVWSNTLQYVQYTNVTLLDGQSLQINAAHLNDWYFGINGMQLANKVASQLTYREVETNGSPNINLKRGTAMFWVKPDWNSGTGPGQEGRLLEVGDQGGTNGWWALYCSTNGSELKFAGKSGSTTSNYFTCPIGWSNVWIHVALTYTETNSALYLNGVQATNGAGVTLMLDQATRFMSGLNVGGDVTGWNNLRGQIDELETYNYPLASNEVQSAYSTMANRDTDGDGLTDRFEHQYGLNYLAWTDPNDDSDYDGRTLLQEQADGTDPRNGASVAKVRLGYWKFDTAQFLGEQGQVPKSVFGVTNVVSWDGQALRSTDPGGSGRLAYRDVETNGNANINCRQGSISFWFRPAWSSTSLGGTGPGSWGRLIELGQWASPATDGAWILHLNPEGTQMLLYSQTNGAAAAYLWPSVSLTSNYWHHVVVTYGPSSTAIYLDGTLIQTGSGITVWPSASVRAATGFSIGSDSGGGQRAMGDFEELETYTYPLSLADVQAKYNADFDGDGVPNFQDARPRDPGITTFTVTIETPAAGSVVR